MRPLRNPRHAIWFIALGMVLIASAAMLGGCSGRTPKAGTPADSAGADQSAGERSEATDDQGGDQRGDSDDARAEDGSSADSGDAIEGIPWVMTEMTSEGGGGLVGPAENGAPTITFANGKVAGNSGINSFKGEYEIEGERFKVKAATVTNMDGDVDLMDQESAFLAALGKTSSYSIDAGELRLLAEDGTTLLVFAAP